MEQILMKVKALADPTRLKLIRLLLERECAVNELVEILATGQSGVSQHLAKLKAAGLVRERRDGRQILYSADLHAVLGLDQSLMTFLYTPLEQLPDLHAEWRRWPYSTSTPSGAETAGSVPILFRPAPSVDARTPDAGGHRRPRILYLCTANSCRSQMAEAWTRTLAGNQVEVQSAGLEPSRIHPLAIASMREVGIDLAGQYSKAISPGLLAEADVIVTLCGSALGWFPLVQQGTKVQHWPYPDPAALVGAEEAVMRESRAVRDGIRRRVENLLASLGRVS